MYMNFLQNNLDFILAETISWKRSMSSIVDISDLARAEKLEMILLIDVLGPISVTQRHSFYFPSMIQHYSILKRLTNVE